MTEQSAPNSRKRRRRILAGVATGLVLAGSGVSIAAAAQSAPPTKAPASQEQESGEKPEATYKSSITSPEAPEANEANEADEAASEKAEAAALAKLAKVTPAQAADAATKAVPGKAATPELSNENGNVVYDVTVTSSDGKTQTDVKVDAGNAKVLAQEVDNEQDGNEAGDGNETPDAGEKAGTETNDAPASAPAAPSTAPGAATGN